MVGNGVLDGTSLDNIGVLYSDALRAEPGYVEHTKDLSAAQEWDPQHGANALSPKDRVRDSGVVDAVQCDGPLLGGDPSRKALSQWDPDALADLLLDSAGCTSFQLLGPLLARKDGRRVRDEEGPRP